MTLGPAFLIDRRQWSLVVLGQRRHVDSILYPLFDAVRIGEPSAIVFMRP